jgi:hypothetical protein
MLGVPPPQVAGEPHVPHETPHPLSPQFFPAHDVFVVCVQAAVQVPALFSVSIVHVFPSSQLVGQLPSQVSLPETHPSPQTVEQSVSLQWVQPAGQHPSPLKQAVIVVG